MESKAKEQGLTTLASAKNLQLVHKGMKILKYICLEDLKSSKVHEKNNFSPVLAIPFMKRRLGRN